MDEGLNDEKLTLLIIGGPSWTRLIIEWSN